MSAPRDIEVTIRITGDTGIPNAQVIERINRLLDMPQWKLADELGVSEYCKTCVDVTTKVARDLLPTPGRWKVVQK